MRAGASGYLNRGKETALVPRQGWSKGWLLNVGAGTVSSPNWAGRTSPSPQDTEDQSQQREGPAHMSRDCAALFWPVLGGLAHYPPATSCLQLGNPGLRLLRLVL